MVLLFAFHIGGLILLIASGAAVFFNRRVRAEERSPFGRWLRTRGWQVGVLLGLLSVFSQYPLHAGGEWYRIFGIPFIVGAVGGGEGHPHGPGLPSMALNFLFWLLLPQFVLWVTSGRPPRRRRESPGEPHCP